MRPSLSDRSVPSYFSRWVRFILERFEPLSHLALITLFVAAHGAVAERIFGQPLAWPVGVAAFVGTLIFFFKLRLYDEIKDYEVDLECNPTRPLARGLLTQRDLKWAIGVCILIELVAFALSGPAAFGAAVVAIGYSLLMYHEFFIGPKIRPLLTTYAVSHTFVSVLLSWTILRAFGGSAGWENWQGEWMFALNSWCLFNVFEFGRKTFVSAEERDGVPSYSKVFGRLGAVVLVLAMAGGSMALLRQSAIISSLPAVIGMAVAIGALGLSGALFSGLNRRPFGAIYRAVSSLTILIVYAIVILG